MKTALSRLNTNYDPPKRRISAKVRQAIIEMARYGRTRAEAAAIAGLQEDSLYRGLRSREAKLLYAQELEEIRVSERGRTFHTLLSLRDDAANGMVRLGACKELVAQEMGFSGRPPGVPAAPGVIINIVGNRNEPVKTILDTGPTKPVDEFKDQLEPPVDDIPVPDEPDDDTAGVDD